MRRAHKAAEAGGVPKMEGQRPRCPHATRTQGRRGRRPSTKMKAAALLTLCRAAITPPGPAALHKNEGAARLLPLHGDAAVAIYLSMCRNIILIGA